MYTTSKDGEKRQPVHLSIRLTKKEKSKYDKLAKEHGYKNVKDWLLHNLMVDLGYIEERLSKRRY